jgi:hypothetical protein
MIVVFILSKQAAPTKQIEEKLKREKTVLAH